jgi:hypothetical protein
MTVSLGLSLLFRIIRWLRRIGELSVRYWHIRTQLLLGPLRKIFRVQVEPRISHEPRSRCCIDPSVNASSFDVVDPTPHRVDTPEGHAPTQLHYSLAVPMVPGSQSRTSFQVQDPNNVAGNAACTGDEPDPTNAPPSESLAAGVYRTLAELRPLNGPPASSFSSSRRMPEPIPMLANEIRRYDRRNVVCV